MKNALRTISPRRARKLRRRGVFVYWSLEAASYVREWPPRAADMKKESP